MSAFSDAQDRILEETDALDVEVVREMDTRMRDLRRAILAILLLLPPGGALQFYYNNILQELGRALDDFDALIRTDMAKAFETYWKLGEEIGQAAAKATGGSFYPTSTLDKEVMASYILDEASAAVAALRVKLGRALNQGLLGEQSTEAAVHNMATLLGEEKIVKTFLQGITAQLLAAVEKAEVNYIEGLVARDATLKGRLTKIWNWSHVSRVNHAAMDGVEIPWEERFNVPGWGAVPAESMFAPHDPSANPGQVLNCKCYLTIGGL